MMSKVRFKIVTAVFVLRDVKQVVCREINSQIGRASGCSSGYLVANVDFGEANEINLPNGEHGENVLGRFKAGELNGRNELILPIKGLEQPSTCRLISGVSYSVGRVKSKKVRFSLRGEVVIVI